MQRNERLLSASMLTGTGWDMLPERVRKLRASEEEASKALRKLKEKLAEREADELLLSGELLPGEIPLVCYGWEDRPVDELKRIAARISEQGGVALLGTMEGDAAKLVFARGSRPDVNLSDLLKECVGIAGGKGGGRPHLAQGSAPDARRLGEMLEHAKRRLPQ
jgi:alanyl-tRNA synthetase